MESVFGEHLPRLVASWNPHCSAVNRSVVQQLGLQIVALEDDLCRLRAGLKADCEVRHCLAGKEKEVQALRESTERLERALLRANDRINELERQNEKLIILQHAERLVIQKLSCKLKVKPRQLAGVGGEGWEANEAAVALERLVLAESHEALKRRFEQASRLHLAAVDRIDRSHQMALREKVTDLEELRKRNAHLLERTEELKSGALEQRWRKLESLQRDFAAAVVSRAGRGNASKAKDLQQHELVKIVDRLEREINDKDEQLRLSKSKMAEQVRRFSEQLQQLRQRKRRDEEGLRNHVKLLEQHLRKFRTQTSKNDDDTASSS